MRSDWVPVSASALVTGVMALVLGSLLNPTTDVQGPGQTLRVVEQSGGRWMATAVLFFLASVALTLGLPALLSLFARRGRAIGYLGIGVFAVGAIATSGYAMLMVFFRALVHAGAVRHGLLQAVTHDAGFETFLYAWIGAFYGGVLLLAVGLFRARSTPVWVPALLVVFVAFLPVSSMLGRVGTAVQLMTLAVAFTGLAVAVTSPERRTAVAVGAP